MMASTEQRRRRVAFLKECAAAGALFVAMVGLLGLADLINR